MITNAGQILNTSAADKHGRVLLQIVTFAGDITVPSCLLVRRTLAIFLIAELGFLGVVVVTERQTPRFCGQLSRMGDLLLYTCFSLPCLIS